MADTMPRQKYWTNEGTSSHWCKNQKRPNVAIKQSCSLIGRRQAEILKWLYGFILKKISRIFPKECFQMSDTIHPSTPPTRAVQDHWRLQPVTAHFGVSSPCTGRPSVFHRAFTLTPTNDLTDTSCVSLGRERKLEPLDSNQGPFCREVTLSRWATVL